MVQCRLVNSTVLIDAFFFPHIVLHFYSFSVSLHQKSRASSCWYLEVGFEILTGVGVKVTSLIVDMAWCSDF